MTNTPDTYLEAFTWETDGYAPLVFSADWQVALLNWEPIFDLNNVGEIERHNSSDEVFVLLKGQAILFVVTPAGLQVADMEPGAIYNVRKGIRHNLISTRDARWVIVEARDTHLHDCQLRRLISAELEELKANLPDWVQHT